MSSTSTEGLDYTERLRTLESARWKQVLDVQAPYRRSIRRLRLGRALEVGCGIGRVLSFLDDAVGVDHNADSVRVARERGLRAWTTAEWPHSDDARPASFDSLVLAHVLEHVDEPTLLKPVPHVLHSSEAPVLNVFAVHGSSPVWAAFDA